MPVRSARTSKRTYASTRRVARVRKTSHKKQKNFNFKRAFAVFGLFVVSGLLVASFIFYKQLSKEFVAADSPAASNVASQDIVTVLYASTDDFTSHPLTISSLYLIFLDKNNKKTVSYEIPVDYELDAPGKFGVERLDKLVALGGLDCEQQNCVRSNLLTRGVEKLFGVKVDKHILVTKAIKETTDKVLLSSDVLTTFNLSFYKELPHSVETDLTISEVYELYKFIKSLPEDRFIKRSLTRDMLSSYDYLDDDVQDISFDSDISKERLGVSVLNGCGKEGVAAYGARVVNNASAHLLALSNASRSYNESVIVATRLDSATVKYLTKMFNVQKVYQTAEAAGFGVSENEIDRSDIVLILGQDFLNSY